MTTNPLDGFVLCPREPTSPQTYEGMLALNRYAKKFGNDEWTTSQSAIYQAMLSAADPAPTIALVRLVSAVHKTLGAPGMFARNDAMQELLEAYKAFSETLK